MLLSFSLSLSLKHNLALFVCIWCTAPMSDSMKIGWVPRLCDDGHTFWLFFASHSLNIWLINWTYYKYLLKTFRISLALPVHRGVDKRTPRTERAHARKQMISIRLVANFVIYISNLLADSQFVLLVILFALGCLVFAIFLLILSVRSCSVDPSIEWKKCEKWKKIVWVEHFQLIWIVVVKCRKIRSKEEWAIETTNASSLLLDFSARKWIYENKNESSAKEHNIHNSASER